MEFDQGQPPVIACVNKATVSLGISFDKLVTVLQKYVNQYFSPVWGTPCTIIKANSIPAKAWGLVFLDNADVQGALGYHDLTPGGLPMSKVFVKTSLRFREPISVVATHELCLSGDTKIPLLNGTEIEIRNLVGRSFWVYSCDGDGNIKPGYAHSVRLTERGAQTIRITLDNGEIVRCTTNHKVMLRDGSYREAGALMPGDSLMPLYKRRTILDQKRNRKGMYQYEQVLNPRDDKWYYTHRIVTPNCPSGFVRHHKDFNRFNNDPTNIEILGWRQHYELHSLHAKTLNAILLASGRHPFQQPRTQRQLEICSYYGHKNILTYNKSEKCRQNYARHISVPARKQKMLAGLHQYTNSDKGRATTMARLAKLQNSIVLRQTNKLLRIARNKLPQQREMVRQDTKCRMNLTIGHERQRVRALALHLQILELYERGFNFKQIAKSLHMSYVGLIHHMKRFGYPAEHKQTQRNHKVVSVCSAEPCDVYDMAVDGYHNFAISQGVFVHNCEMLVDPAINLSADGPNGTFFAYEVSDAVEGITFIIDGAPVSDFVFPSYFEKFRRPRSARFDYANKVIRPFQILPGGYMIINRSGHWTEIFGSAAKKTAFMREDRRGHRSECRKHPSNKCSCT